MNVATWELEDDLGYGLDASRAREPRRAASRPPESDRPGARYARLSRFARRKSAAPNLGLRRGGKHSRLAALTCAAA